MSQKGSGKPAQKGSGKPAQKGSGKTSGVDLQRIFNYIDSHETVYVQRLRESVAIASVSAWADNRPLVRQQIQDFADRLTQLGGTYEMVEPGFEELEGEQIALPPIMFGELGHDSTKKTVLIYGHLDVQPALQSDGWDDDPFTLQEKPDGKLVGRGTTDDKGPCLSWMNCIEAHQELNVALPVNLKFIFEGMEEAGDGGIEKAINDRIDTPFIQDVDYVCISDNYWLGKTKPCVTYGLRGVLYFEVQVECASQDLHSGIYGGCVHEAMSDLTYLLANLVDNDGNILVPGIMDNVEKLTSDELALYEAIDFDIEEFRADIGANELMHKTKEEVLMGRWRYPSLSIHGIEGAFYEPGQKTVIPAKVTGKFSIRTVPNMSTTRVTGIVKKYLRDMWQARGSPNTMNCDMVISGDPWMSDFLNPHFDAAKAATEIVHGQIPDYTREGGSIPVVLTIANATGKSTLLLPMGRSDDGAHSQNEKLDKSNYMNGIKLAAAYFSEVSKL